MMDVFSKLINLSVNMCYRELNKSVSKTAGYYFSYSSEKYDISELAKYQVRAAVNSTGATEESLFYLDPQERSIFSAVYLLIYVIAFFGNIAAIVVTLRRKQRCIQKTCIISLALSDFITATSMMVMYMSVFTQPLIVWVLGSFMCSFLPSVPVFGVICSSAALVMIAMDRYWNVVHALKKRWNPPLWYCLTSAALLWIVSAGFAYPMYTFFSHEPLTVIYFDHTNRIPLYFEKKHICITFRKTDLQIYYICLMSIVFIPMLWIFIWLYVEIAKLIWKHRKPLSSVFNKKIESSTTGEASTSQTRISEDCSRTTVSSDLNLKSVVKSRNMRAERKIRTFKIIVFIMCAFMTLRLPSIIFDTVKLSVLMNKHVAWIVKYILCALTLLNCALNPFLYTFLNKTLEVFTRVMKTLKEFTCEVCCCCFSTTEFEEFENENPFMHPKPAKDPRGSDSSHSKKSNPKSSRVQFEELPAIKLYSPEGTLPQESYKEIKKY